jgi:molybdopterin synthase catalytic subunit
MVHVELREKPFDPWLCLLERQSSQASLDARSGATAVFVGTMRDFNEGDDVTGMYLEHYPGMTERQLEVIAVNAASECSLDEVLVLHRVGQISPAEPIVLVAVWSAHRAEAFSACRQIMEMLKHSAPFWKREMLADGSVRWVEKNTAG